MRAFTHVATCATVALLGSSLSCDAFGRPASAQRPIGATVNALNVERARIARAGKRHKFSVDVLQPSRFVDRTNRLLVSVEVPKESAILRFTAQPFAEAGKKGFAVQNAFKVAVLENAVQETRTTFPPGPNDSTRWVTLNIPTTEISLLAPVLHVELELETAENVRFTRVLLGTPSTPNSRIVGAFADPVNIKTANLGGPIIKAGIDYLGTVKAIQHFRIPANTLGAGTEAFDAMVEFAEAPLNPTKSNADTVMLRTQDVRPGETTPVRLIAFANKSASPILVRSPQGDLHFNITARLSPNAESGGFITINADGTYKSTTTLYPLLEFQRVEEGKPVGDVISIDTARTPIPGFPFYLASQGGRWRIDAPPGRFTSEATSNFFYANPNNTNTFIHSNGIAPGVPAGCSKSSASSI